LHQNKVQVINHLSKRTIGRPAMSVRVIDADRDCVAAQSSYHLALIGKGKYLPENLALLVWLH
jgi:hypothetical protein